MEVDEQYADIDGVVQSIVVKNFFCHDHFEIEFKTNVTYLVGRNGSGKSAFVTALVVGFGGKAAATSRGTSLTCFIKKGAESASVAIKIKNSSPTAYKHEEYGDTITVIHEFSMSGSSTYKVKSHTGKIISTKFQDVQDIALAHNIQVDNPISVLNQDEARSFHSNEPEKKYAFFRKATNFDKTEKFYKEALLLCDKAEDKWKIKKNAASSLETEYKQWETLEKKMASRREIEDQKKMLENEYYWGEVVELERALEEAREQQRRRGERAARLQAELNELAALAESGVDEEREQLQAAQKARDAAQRRLQAAEEARRVAEAAALSREHAVRRLRDERERERRKLQDVRDEIQNMEAGASTSARADLEARAAASAAAAAAARARLSTAEHTTDQARQNAARARDQCDEAQERLKRLRSDTEALRQALRSLQRAGSDSLAVYGPEMAELRRRVDAAVARGAFSEPPRGPVGAYIKLRDEQYGSALEHILRRSLSTFCTNTARDSQVLFDIIKKVYGPRDNQLSVSYGRFLPRAHDVSAAAVRAPGLQCALDAVRVADPVVANYLIDNLALETVLLAPDDEAAMRLTSDVRRVPPNLRRVVTRDCSEFYPAPNYRTYGGRPRPLQYLHRDLADRIRQVQAELEASALAEREGAAAAEAAAAARRAADVVLRAEQRALQALRLAAEKAGAADEAARAALRQHHAPTLQALEEELRVLEDRLKKIEENLKAAEGVGGGEGDLKAHDQRVRAAADELRQAKQTYRALQERAQEQQIKAENARSQHAVTEQRLAALLAEQERARAALDAAAADLDTKRAAARELDSPERFDNPRSTREVKQLLAEVNARLCAGLGTTLSRAAVGERLLRALKQYHKVQRELKRCRQLIDQIKELVNKHLKMCYNMQKDIVRSVQYSFKRMLSLRDYTGALEVDMGRGELSVACAPAGKAAGGTASLSGGERSYATVALLMALWECVDLPFFFLDEFDVFMDNVNRTVVMELLEDHALQHRGRQFVFLTPQDGSAIRGTNSVTIFRMG